MEIAGTGFCFFFPQRKKFSLDIHMVEATITRNLVEKRVATYLQF